MNTLAWVFIFVGFVVIRSASKGRGLSAIPTDLGDLFTAILSNDMTSVKDVLNRQTVSADEPTRIWKAKPDTYNLGKVDPTLNAIANDVGARFALTTIGGYRASDPYPDHPSGKAADFMVGNDTAKGDAIVAYLQANAGAFGVKYLMWRQRSWTPERGWKAMTSRGSATANHMDHVHLTIK
jgi:hypothetical protein